MPSNDWQRILAEVAEQVTAELIAAENTPLEFGAFIAWTECQLGRTNGFSPVHRVGFPQLGDVYTTCGELIPPPKRWMPLSGPLVASMMDCQFCRAEMARIDRENAA